MKYVLCALVALSIVFRAHSAETTPSLAVMLMHNTFKIEGPSATTPGVTHGTAFLVAQRDPKEPTKGQPILVTAAHVLKDIAGTNATLFVRRKAADGSFERIACPIPIRNGTNALWVAHPEVDVAAMPVVLPKYATGEMPMIHTGFLGDDNIFEQQDLGPGDELMCLGYPLGIESPSGGFPILRTGRIASYPIRPSTLVKAFLYDFQIYGGNSGGPVFFEYTGRRVRGEIKLDVTVQCVVGLVSQDISYTRQVESYFEKGTRRDPLGLAIVIPGEFIKQTIELLPKTVVTR